LIEKERERKVFLSFFFSFASSLPGSLGKGGGDAPCFALLAAFLFRFFACREWRRERGVAAKN